MHSLKTSHKTVRTFPLTQHFEIQFGKQPLISNYKKARNSRILELINKNAINRQ